MCILGQNWAKHLGDTAQILDGFHIRAGHTKSV